MSRSVFTLDRSRLFQASLASEKLRPSSGDVLEICLVWGEKVMDTKHFSLQDHRVIKMGGKKKDDLLLPKCLSQCNVLPQIKISGGVRVQLSVGQKAQLEKISGKLEVDAPFQLEMGEMATLPLSNQWSLVLRFVRKYHEIPRGGSLALTMKEQAALVTSGVLVFLGAFFVNLFAPKRNSDLDLEKEETPRLTLIFEKQPLLKNVVSNTSSLRKNTTDSIRRQVTRDMKLESPPPFVSPWMKKFDRVMADSKNILNLAKNANGVTEKQHPGSGSDSGLGPRLTNIGATASDTRISRLGKDSRYSGLSKLGKNSGFESAAKSYVEVQVEAEPEEVVGEINREAVRRVLRENERQIRSCYESGLDRTPGLHGKVILEWIIGERGRVRDAHVKSSTLVNKMVEECLITRLSSWRFPDPPAGHEAKITFPLIFSPVR